MFWKPAEHEAEIPENYVQLHPELLIHDISEWD